MERENIFYIVYIHVCVYACIYIGQQLDIEEVNTYLNNEQYVQPALDSYHFSNHVSSVVAIHNSLMDYRFMQVMTHVRSKTH